MAKASSAWLAACAATSKEVVLDPAQGKGYRVRISGLADNFQLHTLLADALIGRFSNRWLRGRRPSRAEVATARDGPIHERGPSAYGSFNLWAWRGLTAEGKLRNPMAGRAYWIWNEGVCPSKEVIA